MGKIELWIRGLQLTVVAIILNDMTTKLSISI